MFVSSLLVSLLLIGKAAGFAPFLVVSGAVRPSTTVLSSLQEPPKKDSQVSLDQTVQESNVVQEENADGLPWWWELVWKLDIMKQGEPGQEIIFGDTANVLRTNIEQIYGGYDSLDGCPLAEGRLHGLICCDMLGFIHPEPFALWQRYKKEN